MRPVGVNGGIGERVGVSRGLEGEMDSKKWRGCTLETIWWQGSRDEKGAEFMMGLSESSYKWCKVGISTGKGYQELRKLRWGRGKVVSGEGQP